MNMRIPEIDSAIAVCDAHLRGCNGFNTKIESYLVSYLLVLIASSFEKRFQELIQAHLVCINKDNVRNDYFNGSIKKIFKRYKTSEIAEVIRLLGPLYTERFNEIRNNRKIKRIFTSYDNIVNNRHEFAHGSVTTSGLNMTFPEVVRSYEECHLLLDLFEQVLTYNPNNLKSQKKRIIQREQSEIYDCISTYFNSISCTP